MTSLVEPLSGAAALASSLVMYLRTRRHLGRFADRTETVLAQHKSDVAAQLAAVQAERAALAAEHARKAAPPPQGIGFPLEYEPNSLWLGPTGERFMFDGESWRKL